jgi:hypothetical protein
LNGRIRPRRLLAAACLGAALAVALAEPVGAPVARRGTVTRAATHAATPWAPAPRALYTAASLRATPRPMRPRPLLNAALRARTQPAAPRTPRPGPLYTAASVRAARRWAATRPGLVAFAVRGQGGRLRGWRRAVAFPSASVVKAMLMLAELRAARGGRAVPVAVRPLLRKMITESDNDAALAIYARVGRGGLERVARAAGMRRFAVPGTLFDAQVTAADLVRLFIRVDTLVAGAHRELVLRLLGSIVPQQRWGIAEIGRRRGMTPYFKGGWREGLVHQAALLEEPRPPRGARRARSGGRRIALAVLTADQPSFVAGAATIAGIAARVLVSRSSAARSCSPRTRRRTGSSSGPGCAP